MSSPVIAQRAVEDRDDGLPGARQAPEPRIAASERARFDTCHRSIS
jgi:hypothetical protein